MNILKYSKALVPLTLTIVALANAYFGTEIPIGETEAIMITGLITTFVVWLVPNKKDA